uniref:Stum, mechanosensory transduction mediator homolog n=1 Tax=Equus asinus TaxID=9793 RepID=A0A9L0JE31_EQUAS
MEPSHKDAETAAAAAAVAAADPRGASSSSGVVVQVREKKGPLRAAIPYMPFPVAVICLFLNTFVPGLGVCEGDLRDLSLEYLLISLLPSTCSGVLDSKVAQVSQVHPVCRAAMEKPSAYNSQAPLHP